MVDGARTNRAATGLVILLHVLFSGEGVSVYAIDHLRTLSIDLPTLAKLKQVFRLDLEQAALDGRGAARPP
jgi:hypothetical protein